MVALPLDITKLATLKFAKVPVVAEKFVIFVILPPVICALPALNPEATFSTFVFKLVILAIVELRLATVILPPVICALDVENKLADVDTVFKLVIPTSVPPVTVILLEYKFVTVAVVAVKLVIPLTVPPVIRALPVEKLVIWATVDVTLELSNVPRKLVATTVPAETLPFTFPVNTPLKVVATTLPVTLPVN